MADLTSLSDRVFRVVVGVFADRGIIRRPVKSDNLFAAGLTSLGLVALMLAIEGEFDLTIPTADLTPENFDSAQAVETLVERLMPAHIPSFRIPIAANEPLDRDFSQKVSA